jgi:hypothetical protein
MKQWNDLLRSSVLLSFCLLIMLLVNPSHVKAQSLNHEAYELFNLLEHLYPEILSPTAQATKEGRDTFLRPYFYRSYSDTNIEVRTYLDQGNLYLLDAQAEHDLGAMDYWLSFTKAEILFNWCESKFPELLSPSPQVTQMEGEIFYRSYPDTNVLIGTFQRDLYFVDDQGIPYNLGQVDPWVDEIVDFPEVLGGVYTIQQACNGRYVDAYTYTAASHEYNLVTRAAQDDDTQKWIITPLGNNVYTIQQKYNNRYVDAYTYTAASHEYNLVTRPAQNDDTQKWIITPSDNNVYTIQQKYNNRYVDAYTDSHDYDLVTRSAQNDNTQKWIINWVPDDKKFLDIEYLVDEAEIVLNEPTVLHTATLENPTADTQTRSFSYSETVQETSSFQHSAGVEVTLGMEFSAGLPGLAEATGWVTVTGRYDFTWGEQKTITRTYTDTCPVVVGPYKTYRVTAPITTAQLSVPYVMFFQSEQTGGIYESRGIWHGVTSWNQRTVIEDITTE